MGLFTMFATILKLLWPFLKENMLQDGTLRDWFRRNRATCIQLMFQLIMLGVCFFLADMLMRTREMDRQTTEQLNKLQNKYDVLNDKHVATSQMLKDETASNARMRVFLVERCRQYPEPCQFLIEETVRRQNGNTTPEQAKETNDLWCGVVQQKDFANDAIRQRYLLQCSDHKPAEPAKP